MLYSKKYNFCFVHIPKNAGSSIRAALDPYISKTSTMYIGKISRLLNLDLPFGIIDPFAHATASECKLYFGNKWNNMNTFAVVRNPWDWQVSFYVYVRRSTVHKQHELFKSMTFDQFIDFRKSEYQTQSSFIVDPRTNKSIVSDVIKYENLEEEFNALSAKLGIKVDLPHKNVSKKKSYKDFYSTKTIEAVEEIYQEDIKRFGYSFES